MANARVCEVGVTLGKYTT